MKRHLIYAACTLVLICLVAVLPAAVDAGRIAFASDRGNDDISGPIVDGMEETGGTVAESVDIQALTNGQDADTPPGPSIPVGSAVQWRYVVTNTGNVALTNVKVTDDRGVAVAAPKTVLEPSESMTATATGTAVAGQYSNLGTVTSISAIGGDVTASDPSHYYGIGSPIANFTANVTDGIAPLDVRFTDTSTGDGITNWSWDFGDGETSTEQHPNHTYNAIGTYDVNLTVTNGGGSDSEVKTGYIRVMPDLPPLGGDRGYFLVSTAPAGAEIYLEDISQTRYHVGNTSAGPLNVTIMLTATPMRAIIANLSGYADAVYTIDRYPPRGGTVPVNLTLEPATEKPFPAPHVPATVIQAEDFDLGGEGVAYHDMEPANLGGAYRPAEGVDIETAGGVTDVGWIRAGERLGYSIDTTIAGRFTLTLRAANPDATAKTVTVCLDDDPVGEVVVDGTGGWTVYREFSGATPMWVSSGRHVVTLTFDGVNRVNLDWLRLSAGPVPTATATVTTTARPSGATFTAAPLTAPRGSAVKFALTPAAGKTVKSVWWSFDAPAHMNTWNSRATNPTFFYPSAGTFSPLVKITYTDGTTETVQRTNYVRAV